MIEIYFDGACGPVNPGGTAAYGFLIKKSGRIISQGSEIIGRGQGMTNNLAEYHGLIAALKALLDDDSVQPKDSIAIYTDSSLVFNMISKNWGWNKNKTVWHPHKDHDHLKKLLFEALSLLENLNYTIKWVPREQNQPADDLSKKLIFGKMNS